MKTQSALINPVKLPEERNEAEDEFVKCMKEGKPCKFGKKRPQPGDKNAKTIRAELVRFFTYGGDDEKYPLKGNVIRLQGARVEGSLDLRHADVPYSLEFPHCYFDSQVTMPYLECRHLDFNGSCLAGGLMAYGLKVRKDVLLNKGFSAEDQVNLLDAKIGGNLYCDKGNFKNNKQSKLDDEKTTGDSINAGRLEAGGTVSLTNGFRANGSVNFTGAKIGGDLSCSGGKFINKEGDALIAENITLGGHLFLRNKFLARGDVRLFGANIGGDLHCARGVFGDGIFAQNAKIKSGLVWFGVRGKGVVNLSFASADILVDNVQSQRNFQFNLEGFSYSRFYLPGKAQARIDWLKNRPQGYLFTPQPFEQAAEVLFALGHGSDAREILLEKEKQITGQIKIYNPQKILQWLRLLISVRSHGLRRRRRFLKQIPKWLRELATNTIQKTWRYCWGCFAGYGYRLRWTLAWSAAIIAAGACLFDYADDACHIVPSQPAVVVSEKYMNAQTHKCAVEGEPTKATVRLFPEHSEFHPLAYSVDVFFPFFALHQEPYWEPKSKEGYPEILPHILRLWFRLEVAAGWLHQEPYQDPKSEENLADIGLYFLRFWFWLEIALGWFLTSLAVLSITGLLRPRQSSGDKE